MNTTEPEWKSVDDVTPGCDQFPSVSIIVPVFNAQQTIVECIAALTKQDYAGEFEILVVDNESTDQSHELAAAFSTPVKLLTERRPGASAARNTGIRDASYDLIAFIDADCIARPDWLSSLSAVWQQGAGLRLVGGSIVAREPTNSIGKYIEFAFD
jgi:glycosyltransferase involved in cell wall biosynthesis